MPPQRRQTAKIASTEAATTNRRKRGSRSRTAGIELQLPVLQPGCLHKLLELPLDILAEIFGHLHPRDLLSMARVSRLISRYICGSEQEFIWRAAMQRTEGVPECPPFLTERAFAHYLFSPCCHTCGGIDETQIYEPWFTRCCRSCWPGISIDGLTASTMYFALDQRLRDQGDFREIFNVLMPYDGISPHNFIQQRQFDVFLRDWQSDPTPEGRSELLQRQKSLVQARDKHVQICRDWHKKEKAKEAARKGANTRRTRAAIVARLRELGFEREVEVLRTERKLPKMFLMKSVRNCTDPLGQDWEAIYEEFQLCLLYARLKLEARIP